MTEDEVVRITWPTGQMTVIMPTFFPCGSKNLRTLIETIDEKCSWEKGGAERQLLKIRRYLEEELQQVKRYRGFYTRAAEVNDAQLRKSEFEKHQKNDPRITALADEMYRDAQAKALADTAKKILKTLKSYEEKIKKNLEFVTQKYEEL